MAEEYLTYKGKPLVRCKEQLYYGDMSDKYVVALTIKDSEKKQDIKTATRVGVQLLSTDTSLEIVKRIIRSSEKGGLYEALDVGAVWLERALKEDKKDK